MLPRFGGHAANQCCCVSVRQKGRGEPHRVIINAGRLRKEQGKPELVAAKPEESPTQGGVGVGGLLVLFGQPLAPSVNSKQDDHIA
jgi:hypothetical protein